jgi:hypothetical protein
MFSEGVGVKQGNKKQMREKNDAWMVALVNGGSVIRWQGYFESNGGFEFGSGWLAAFYG